MNQEFFDDYYRDTSAVNHKAKTHDCTGKLYVLIKIYLAIAMRK